MTLSYVGVNSVAGASETDLKLTVVANLIPVSHKECKSFCNISDKLI